MARHTNADARTESEVNDATYFVRVAVDGENDLALGRPVGARRPRGRDAAREAFVGSREGRRERVAEAGGRRSGRDERPEKGVEEPAARVVARGRVEEGDAAAGVDEVTPPLDGRRGVREEPTDERREDGVGPRNRRCGRVGADDRDVVVFGDARFGPVEKRTGDVDPDDAATRTDPLAEMWQVRAGPTAHIDDGIAR